MSQFLAYQSNYTFRNRERSIEIYSTDYLSPKKDQVSLVLFEEGTHTPIYTASVEFEASEITRLTHINRFIAAAKLMISSANLSSAHPGGAK